MMIVHVPANGTKATLSRCPRDSYVAIPGIWHEQAELRLPVPGTTPPPVTPNAKRAGRGETAGRRPSRTSPALTIDHFVQVDLLGFYRISNAIGRVTVNMCAGVTEPDSGINLHKGINHIKGTQALAFVRQRYNFPNGLGDLDRVERQRYFLTAAFRKLTSAGVLLNPVKLQNLLNAVKSSLYMDSASRPVAAGPAAGEPVRRQHRRPDDPDRGFADENVGSVVVVVSERGEGVRQQADRLRPTPSSPSAQAVAPSTVTVDVLNAGSGVNLAAATNAAGAAVSRASRSARSTARRASTSTVIEYADGMQAQAKTLAAYVPGATYLETASVARVTLLLGADGLAATEGRPPSSATTSTAPDRRGDPRTEGDRSGCIN